MADEGVAVDGITEFNARRIRIQSFFFSCHRIQVNYNRRRFLFFYGWLCQRMLKAIEKGHLSAQSLQMLVSKNALTRRPEPVAHTPVSRL